MDDPKSAPVGRRVLAGAHGADALKFGDLTERKKQRPDPFAPFLPNRVVSSGTMQLIIAIEVAIALVLWWKSPFKALPRIDEVIHSLGDLWTRQGLLGELSTSFFVNLEALAIATAISLVLAYLTVIPVFRPIVAAISKGRFLGLAGLVTVFYVVLGTGHAIKIGLLVFGIGVFFVTSMASVIVAIPKAEFEHARTLRMSEWRVVGEVVILGTVDKAFEVLRQNAAMGWMMLTMVEGIVKSEGGLGTVLIAQDKYYHLPAVFAIQIVILIVGLCQDAVIGFARHLCCPYADMVVERR